MTNESSIIVYEIKNRKPQDAVTTLNNNQPKLSPSSVAQAALASRS